MALQQIILIEFCLNRWVNKYQESDTMVSVELIPGKKWIPILFTPGTADYDEKPKASAEGISYVCSLKCNFSTDNEEKIKLISFIEGRDIIVRFKYNTGNYKIFGTKYFPAKLMANFENKTNSIFKLTLESNSIYRSRFLSF